MDSEISDYVSKLANLVDDAAAAYSEIGAPVSISVDLDEHWVATFHLPCYSMSNKTERLTW